MTTPIPAIEGKTTVNLSRDRAFALFTESFGAWWPHQYHIGTAEDADVVLEPHEGGGWVALLAAFSRLGATETVDGES